METYLITVIYLGSSFYLITLTLYDSTSTLRIEYGASSASSSLYGTNSTGAQSVKLRPYYAQIPLLNTHQLWVCQGWNKMSVSVNCDSRVRKWVI